MNLFLVREEGGFYVDDLSVKVWCAQIHDAPIWGVRIGSVRVGYDAILRGLGHHPWWCTIDGLSVWHVRRRLAHRFRAIIAIFDSLSA